MYYSQWEQDKWLNENIFKNKKNGVFVDIGAHDGVTLSNTYFYEKELEWTGLCIEPIPKIYQKLCKNRKAICVHGCVYDRNGTITFRCLEGYTEMLSGIEETYNNRHNERVNREIEQHGGKRKTMDVPCYRLEKLLSDNNITHVDYLSIDTEGSEMQVLNSIDFDNVTIDVIEVEVNYRDEEEKFTEFFDKKGYKLIAVLTCDNIYVRKELI